MRISDWSSDVCSSDLRRRPLHRAVAEGHDARLDRRDIAVGLLQQALAARGQVEGEPGLAELDRIHVDDVQIGEIARRKQAAVVEAIEQGGVAALAFHRMFERDAMAFAIAHPMLERSEEHTSELQSLMRISYAAFCLK